ncbi:hypothetical protein jhhlp_006268 [Lomentospora prolificans]|uniref:Extracellular membrane protein CFEM domain-containing protein n=1 Tax=Lomentospora prolificans TaxID=41688 RepID=A0A2N3N5L2_9PEZI|nr:hypothetical protein jhhlp_006268 [Lomentospora prolificans]
MALSRWPLTLFHTTTALLLLFTTASAHYVNSQASQDVSALLPKCAQECFQSFLVANFVGALCSSTSTFQCVCEQTGASGFTVGEGAVQCLVASQAVGVCTGADFDRLESTLVRAYNMCDGQPNAVKPTHSTIQATLQIGPSSKIFVPKPSSSLSATATTRMTMTPPSLTSTTSLGTRPALPAPTQDAPNSDLAAETGEPQQKGPNDSRLSTAQIAGLSAGLAAAFGIAILLICIARRRRKRDFPDTETGFFIKSDRLKAISRRFSMHPRGHEISAPIHGSPPPRFPMGQYAPKDGRPRISMPQMIEQMSSPELIARGGLPVVAGAIPKSRTFESPKSKSPQPLQKPEMRPGVGLAIPRNPSPRYKNSTPTRVDGKPKLSINTSTLNNNMAASQPTIKPAAASRRSQHSDSDSAMTEFEEDGKDFSPTQVWYPPSAVPQSATTVYVADKFGNWVLADERQRRRISRVELDGGNPVVRNLTVSGRVSSTASRELGPSPLPSQPSKEVLPAVLRPPAEIYRQGKTADRQADSMASSMYPPSSVYPPSSAFPTMSIYTTDGGAWNPTTVEPPPIPANPLVPRPLVTHQQSRNVRQGENLKPQQSQDSVRTRAYSPVAPDPFHDANGFSPARSMVRGDSRVPSPRMGIPAANKPRIFRPSQSSPTPTPSPGVRRIITPNNPQIMATPIVASASHAFIQPYSAGGQTPLAGPSRSGTPASQTQGQRSALLEKRLGPSRATNLSNLTVTPTGSRPSVQSDDQPGPWKRMMRDTESGEYRGELPNTPTWRPLLTPERRGDALYLSLR